MRRLLKLPTALLLSLLLVGPALASPSNHIYTHPCWFEGMRDPALVYVDNLEYSQDLCTEVGARLSFKVCPACSILTYYDYDPLYAIVDQPNVYVYVASYVRATDDGITSAWFTWP